MRTATSSVELAGLAGPNGHPVTPPQPLRAEAEAWMTDELIEETRRVWSKGYRRVITVEEAVEILANVKNAAEAFMDAALEGQSE